MKSVKNRHPRLDAGRIECPDEVMVLVFRGKTPGERIKIASDMYDSARRQINAVLRSQHPDWDSAKIDRETVRRLSHEDI